jgi:hypothetical protein
MGTLIFLKKKIQFFYFIFSVSYERTTVEDTQLTAIMYSKIFQFFLFIFSVSYTSERLLKILTTLLTTNGYNLFKNISIFLF